MKKIKIQNILYRIKNRLIKRKKFISLKVYSSKGEAFASVNNIFVSITLKCL